MPKIDIAVIGAGVVGLGIAAKLADFKHSIYVLERNNSYGLETSSRNSEVIHAGIYYKEGSLKAKTCVEGSSLLYDICKKNKIPHSKIGKLIVSTGKGDEIQLDKLYEKGKNNGIVDLRMLSCQQVKRIEPNIICSKAIYSPSTGIIDSHSLLAYFVTKIKQQGADIAYNSNVIDIKKTSSGYRISIDDKSGNIFNIEAGLVINCAGLDSDKMAQAVGIDIKKCNYELKYCKGQYFRVINRKKCGMISHLIYPVPNMGKGGLGIHATLDLTGSVRLGPDARYIDRDEFNYAIDPGKMRVFLDSVNRYMPFLDESDLIEDSAGIRPKLQGENECFRDFVIREESDLGFPGFINLIGIESPGLTAVLSIAKYVENIIKSMFS